MTVRGRARFAPFLESLGGEDAGSAVAWDRWSYDERCVVSLLARSKAYRKEQGMSQRFCAVRSSLMVGDLGVDGRQPSPSPMTAAGLELPSENARLKRVFFSSTS